MRIFSMLIFSFCVGPAFGLAKAKIMTLSWGDVIWQHRGQGVAQIDTPEKIREAVKAWKAKGVDKVHFRVDDFRILLFCQLSIRPTSSQYHKEWSGAVKLAWERNLVQTACEAIKEEGIQVDMYITIFDEGCPPEVLGGDRNLFPWQSHFTQKNPQFLSVDRSLPGSAHKYHCGVLEYAYPEVREYMLKMITTFSDHFPFDGVFLSVRTHWSTPINSDQRPYSERIRAEI
jgi:hypothetical protein